jgi:hypothetical protein
VTFSAPASQNDTNPISKFEHRKEVKLLHKKSINITAAAAVQLCLPHKDSETGIGEFVQYRLDQRFARPTRSQLGVTLAAEIDPVIASPTHWKIKLC